VTGDILDSERAARELAAYHQGLPPFDKDIPRLEDVLINDEPEFLDEGPSEHYLATHANEPSRGQAELLEALGRILSRARSALDGRPPFLPEDEDIALVQQWMDNAPVGHGLSHRDDHCYACGAPIEGDEYGLISGHIHCEGCTALLWDTA
jgi:hypothetical protein